MEKPYVYLSAEISTMNNEQGDECWAMSSDKYCTTMVKNDEETLAKEGIRIPTK